LQAYVPQGALFVNEAFPHKTFDYEVLEVVVLPKNDLMTVELAFMSDARLMGAAVRKAEVCPNVP
jgi:hypothetical protein